MRDASRAAHGSIGLVPQAPAAISLSSSAKQNRNICHSKGITLHLRLRSHVSEFVTDAPTGVLTGPVDDFVLRRDQDQFAYNFTVVIDDALCGVNQMVRGNDLVESTPRQAYLASLLGYIPVEYIHVPLVVNSDGSRLAKRDGAVTLENIVCASGKPAETVATEVLAWIIDSLGPVLSEPIPQALLGGSSATLLMWVAQPCLPELLLQSATQSAPIVLPMRHS